MNFRSNSSFKQPTYTRQPLPRPQPIRKVALTVITDVALSCPKAETIYSEPYRRLVAAGPCKVCCIVGYSQAAHPNTGKGMGMKTDDRLCFALCTVHPGAGGLLVQGCHEKFDQGALFSQAVRRALEPAWAADTQRRILARGEWPKNLPKPE